MRKSEVAVAIAAGVRPFWKSVSESRRFRFACFRDHSKWLAVEEAEDRELARAGFVLAGPTLDASRLDDEELAELVRLLGAHARELSADGLTGRLAALLARCPRSAFLPPVDLDVADEATRADALAWAAKLDPALERVGLGRPSWHVTGGRAGLHGDLRAPEGFEHPELIRIAGVLVRTAAEAIGLPLLSEHRHTDGRPPVVLDDSLYERNATGRGVIWRLSGAPKPGGGLKTPVALDGELLDFAPAPVPGDAATFEATARQVERQLAAGDRRARATRARAVTPLELPAGTRVLERFAEAFARVLPDARHDMRLAAAGWLLRLGVSPQVAAATLARATGNAEDAEDVVRTTAARLVDGRPVRGLPALASRLGGAAMFEIREALARDGVPKARKALWTDEDRIFLMRVARDLPRGHPGRTAIQDGARCGQFAMPYECPTHGPRGVRLNVEEREVTCPHCREARISSRLAWIRENWRDETAPYRADRTELFGVLVVKPAPDEPDPIRALRTARRRAQRCCFGEERWITGGDHVLLVFKHFDVDAVRLNFGLATRRADGVPVPANAERAAELGPVEFVLEPHVMTKEQVLELFASTWRSVGVAFQALVEARERDAIANFRWLTSERRIVRTNATKKGRVSFPWASNEAIVEHAREEALEERGGVDFAHCDVEVTEGFGFSPGERCGEPYHVYVDHVPSGLRLREEPFVGRFPRKDELYRLLESADPFELRRAYTIRRRL